MAHSIEITSIDNQSPLLLQTEKNDEIEEGRKVDHIIDQNDLDNLSIKSWTISKVYVWLRESNPDAYTPKMVSIGPYHKKNPQLDSMKNYKLLYLLRFLQRKEGLDVESCISELKKLKERALKCYELEKLKLEKLKEKVFKRHSDIKDMDTDEFCEMLLLDGCFVVEFIRERCQMYPEGEEEIININVNYIFRDLMLLENQLPFFVLNKLFHMTRQDDELPLTILVSHWFKPFVDFPFHYEYIGNIKHLLHLLHKYSCQRITEKGPHNDETRLMPNATELSEAGVSFAKVSDAKSLFDIKFENGSMKIPCFRVEDGTETVLRNLIAYEQQSSDVHPKYFSDYATFMDHLIDSDKDVNLLRQKGIIDNFLGEGKEVASLFNKIGNGVTMYPNFYYNEEFKKAVDHCKNPWNKMMASLKHNYFSSPWVGASTVAAIILLILTATQTILAFTGSVK